MENHNSAYSQYGLSFMPVLINRVQDGTAGAQAIGWFLNGAWADLEQEQETEELCRARVNSRTPTRRELLQVARYFDYGRRTHKALRLALKAMEKYLAAQDETLLEQALLQYETGERYRRSRLYIRMSLQPIVCERISRAS
ncbi:MAG: hypothetical protein WC314_05040 [Vulcanimicrobiota bacterium]